MAFIHALHLVLYGMLVVTNLLLIPFLAMVGFRIGDRVAFAWSLNQDLSVLASFVAAFMAVGIVNGSVALVLLHNQPSVNASGAAPRAAPAGTAGSPSRTSSPAKKKPGSSKRKR